MSHEHLENLSLALVREYLSKKGYKQTLNTLQEELPTKPTPTTRAMLTRDLGLSRMVSKNAKSEQPWDTLLEIFTEFMYVKYGSKEREEESTSGKSSSASSSSSSSQPRVPQTIAPSSSSLQRPNSIRTSISSNAPSSISPTAKLSVDSLRRKSSTSPTSSYPITLTSSRSRSSSVSSNQSQSPRSPHKSKGEIVIDDIGSDDELELPPSKPTTKSTTSTHSYSSYSSSSSSFSEQKSSPYNKSSSHGTTPTTMSLSQPMTLSMGTPITIEEAHQLKKLIFGSNALQSFTDAWTKQGFYPKSATVLSETPTLGFALVQAQGGPCGMLAVVQAYMLKELLFGSSNSSSNRTALLTPSSSTYRTALINALSDILWQAGDHRSCRVAVRSKTGTTGGPRKIASETYRPDGLCENINIIAIDSLQNLKTFFTNNIGYWTNENGTGCVCFLFSILLSRGLNNVEADRDDPSASMLGSHSYCTQEMVNLALTGRAHSNVFDGIKDMDGAKLRGIGQQSAIGFLSLFEHHGYIEVGSYYKNPQYPIWVLCSESHYSVLFGLDKSSILAKGIFDLYYYDELANQNEEIKLTIDTTKSGPAPKSDDLEPPINECIRTKWGKHARIDWNGSEPIL